MVNQYWAHSFTRNWQLPFLNHWKEENDRRKYFMINLHERKLPIPQETNRQPSAIFWSPVAHIQLHYRGHQIRHFIQGIFFNPKVCHYENTPIQIHLYIETFTSNKIENVQIKNSDNFHTYAQNIDCGYSFECLGEAVLTSTHNLCFEQI